MARDLTTTTEPTAARTKRVIVQKTSDSQDNSIPLGFNDFFMNVPYNVPVDLPADAVDYWRKQVKYITAPGERGQLTANAVAAVSMIDA